MRILTFDNFLNESNLNIAELSKKYGGEKRGDILLKNILDGEDLELVNDKKVKVSKMLSSDGQWLDPSEVVPSIQDPNFKYSPDKADNYFKKRNKYIDVFEYEDNHKETGFRLTDIKKTKKYGARGSGLNFSKKESMQIVFLAIQYKMIKDGIPNNTINENNYQTFFDHYIDDALMDCKIPNQIDSSSIDEFENDKDWIFTFTRIPNAIYAKKDVNGELIIDTEKNYLFFSFGCDDGNNIIRILRNKYKEFSKKFKSGPINIFKWCPADVYLVDRDNMEDISKDIEQSKSIEELNSCLNYYFDKKQFIPISLKKIKKDSEKITIITNSEIDRDLPIFDISKIIIGSDHRGIMSEILTKSEWKYKSTDKKDQLETKIFISSSDTSTLQNVGGEVLGGSSKHGRVSLNFIRKVLENDQKITKVRIQDCKEISKMGDMEYLEDLFYKLLYDLKYKAKKDDPRIIIEREYQRGSDCLENENRLISRIQSLQVVDAFYDIYKKDEDVANELITKIMRYSLSIETPDFLSPRYLRII